MEVMIDLETMGLNPDAAIVSIGAVKFDLKERRLGDEFYAVVDLESSLEAGGTVTASTILWWMVQSEASRGEISIEGAHHLHEALLNFHCFLVSLGSRVEGGVWGNGAAFDNVILANAYQRCNLEVPWHFTQNRCYRTIRALHPNIQFTPTGTAHNALDDARNQALHLIQMIGG